MRGEPAVRLLYCWAAARRRGPQTLLTPNTQGDSPEPTQRPWGGGERATPSCHVAGDHGPPGKWGRKRRPLPDTL